MNWGLKVLLAYLPLINLIAFVLMGVDKGRARRKEWRISEAKLFLTALLGGGVGAVAGMYVFRHKTRHWYFVVGMPAIAVMNVAFAIIAGKLCMYFWG